MPGHAIPEPYCWDESFKVFYENLDKEHQGLFDGVFACAGAPSDKAKFDSLVGLVKAHFSHEEGMMESASYSNYDSHKKLHDEFVAKLGGSFPLDDGSVKYAKEWLVNHIKDIDFGYKGKL